jgi:hypothetical protein
LGRTVVSYGVDGFTYKNIRPKCKCFQIFPSMDFIVTVRMSNYDIQPNIVLANLRYCG